VFFLILMHRLKRVALVYPYYLPFVGGIETRMHNLAKGLSKKGIEVHVITNSLTDETEELILEDVYLHRFVLPASFKWPYAPDWAAKAESVITATVKKFDIQVIDAQDCSALMACFLAKAAVPSLRVVFTLHDILLKHLPKIEKEKFSFFINCLKWDAMVVPSNYVKEQAQSLAQAKLPIFKIYNGVDTDKFAPQRDRYARRKLDIKANEKVILCPTRIERQKGIIFVIRALKRISEIHDVKLVISGDGAATSKRAESYYQKLVSEVNALGLSDRVIFCNGSFNYDEMPELYSSSDVVVLASVLTEGFGNCIIEGMASGIPVIGTRIGAIPEIIKNERNGLLVEPRNPQMIANAIIRLVNNQEFYRRLKINCRRDALRLFSLDRMASELIDVYTKTIV
jgi:glycosyltransferase involved in cell wall biosynthesis